VCKYAARFVRDTEFRAEFERKKIALGRNSQVELQVGSVSDDGHDLGFVEGSDGCPTGLMVNDVQKKH